MGTATLHLFLTLVEISGLHGTVWAQNIVQTFNEVKMSQTSQSLPSPLTFLAMRVALRSSGLSFYFCLNETLTSHDFFESMQRKVGTKEGKGCKENVQGDVGCVI